MFFKFFRRFSHARPRIEHDSAPAAELARRVNAIDFKPTKGFLKDQQQLKRSAIRAHSGRPAS